VLTLAPSAVVALVAGLLTVIAPCTLPVVPLVLGGASVGGGRRALGIALGFGGTFVVTAVLLAGALAAAGITTSPLRTASAVALALFGLALAVPRAGAWLEARMAPLGRVGARMPGGGSGLAGGLAIGVAVGLLWAPCVGPLLAATLALAVAQGPTPAAVAIGLAYAVGAAIPLLLIAGLGRVVTSRLGSAGARQRLQQAFGVAMVVASVVALTGLDAQLGAPAVAAETSGSAVASAAAPTTQPSPAFVTLDDLGPAPELTGITAWINSSPITLASLRGKVVLLHFWTFACINCQHVQPYIKAWWSEYEDQGLVVIGVHTPELSFERDLGNVRQAVADDGVTFPVAFDPQFATWNAFHNGSWPAMYFIDRDGVIRHAHGGEGDYAASEQVIRELLAMPG
jgi:cytochrome c biogenesis protein CcdA/thiol-disulfide isomerase/thioredoxin